jgi:hypothetical protein
VKPRWPPSISARILLNDLVKNLPPMLHSPGHSRGQQWRDSNGWLRDSAAAQAPIHNRRLYPLVKTCRVVNIFVLTGEGNYKRGTTRTKKLTSGRPLVSFLVHRLHFQRTIW